MGNTFIGFVQNKGRGGTCGAREKMISFLLVDLLYMNIVALVA